MQKLILAATGVALGLTLMTPVAFAAPTAEGFNVEQFGADFDRRKKRIKGGSGCDSARDKIEHPECR